MRFTTFAAVALAGASLGIAACGEDDEGTPASEATPSATAQSTSSPAAEATTPAQDTAGDASTDLKVTGTEEGDGFGFDPETLTAQAGTVTITFDNPEGNKAPHNVTLEGADGATETIQPGATSELTAELTAGEYVYYCSVGQHRQDGMEGTLTVE